MANAFLYDNKLNSVQASLTPSSENTEYPRANLYDYNAAKPFRTEDAASTHTIVQDFGTATGVDAVAIISPNFRSSATIKVQANATDSWGSPSVDQTLTISGLGVDPPHANLYHKFGSTQTYRYWRLSIADSGNPDGYYEVGEWILGVQVAMGTGQDYELPQSTTYPDANVVHQTEWFQDHVHIIDVDDIRTFSVEYANVTQASHDVLRKLKRFVKGSGRPFVFVPNQSATPNEAFYVRITGEIEVVHTSPKPLYSLRMTLREQARGLALPSSA